ncbi:uncharacterized protein C9E9.15-like [Penaeus japonicus]|uniref:uncharacterized protein C9E9.15-like n=1 Tax=Penaeus japonicus TaxID=27405 RepID=UPI001C70C05F|nr:uncharacterized protein C9E9.15-like [Penaeus japonicus]XP_042864256.1 uncharacterized protein C9E9.15-like [Penaeus japonicus]
MTSCAMMRVTGLLLGASLGLGMAYQSSYTINAYTPKMMYDFRVMESLDNWKESSDTVRVPGMSKGVFSLQKSKLFQRAVFFTMLNPQPNGAGFAGTFTNDGWDLSQHSALEMRVRGQGDNYVYKVNFQHKGQEPSAYPSYESFFTVPKNEWTVLSLQLSEFKPYYRGEPVHDAEPLDTSDITKITIQLPGGVYSDSKQSGTSSLEIDYIQAV